MPRNAAERAALGLTGLMLLASALITGRLAYDHMQLSGAVCGSQGLAHCAWCLGTAALVGLAVASWAVALAPVRAALRAGSNPSPD